MVSESHKQTVAKPPETHAREGSASDIGPSPPPESSPNPPGPWWAATYDAAIEPVWLMDVDYHVVQCNQAARQLFGNNLIARAGSSDAGGLPDPAAGYPVLFMRQSDRRESVEVVVGTRRFQVTVDPLFDRA